MDATIHFPNSCQICNNYKRGSRAKYGIPALLPYQQPVAVIFAHRLGHWQSSEYSVYTSHRSATRSHQLFHMLKSWWRLQMETFSALLAICAGNSPVTGEFPAQKPVTRSFGVFFDPRRNKRLGKQSWGWWFETPSQRHCNFYCNCISSHRSIEIVLIAHRCQHFVYWCAVKS